MSADVEVEVGRLGEEVIVDQLLVSVDSKGVVGLPSELNEEVSVDCSVLVDTSVDSSVRMEVIF